MKHRDKTYRVLELLALQPKGWTRMELTGRLEISRATVDRSLAELKEKGLVVVEPKTERRNGRPINVYRIISRQDR